MNSEMALTNQNNDESLLAQFRGRGLNRNTCGAVIGLLGGILAPVFGSLLTAVAWISGPTWHGFSIQRDGAVLLFLTIPLLLFGAHCLDLADTKSRGDRRGNDDQDDA